MNCTTCHRANLAGGVRCVYCGVPLSAALDFDLSGAASAGPANAASTGPTGKQTTRQGKKMGLWGSLVLLAVKAKSLLVLLKFGKIATTLFSMLAFIWADALIFGWKFGVGIAICILIHEMGHVFVNWRKGLKQTAPMFIPFVGAVIFIKGFPDDPTVQSESGAGGPAAGALAALACLLIGVTTGSPYWLALANIGFAINLFNLVPFPPLDGSHISSVFSPKVWDAVLIGLLLWVLKMPSALLWFILVIGFLFRLGRGSESRYLLAAPMTRVRMALVYLGLCIVLASGVQYTLPARSAMYRPASSATQVNPAVQNQDDTASEPSSGGGNQSALWEAFLAAALVAFLYAGYQAVHWRGRKPRPVLSSQIGRGLAWATGAALLVAYVTSNWTAAGVTVFFVFLFYMRAPWMLASLAGNLAEQMGDLERSLTLRRRAVSLRPDRESAADLLTHLARLNVVLSRGGAALEAVDARDRQFAPQQASVTTLAPVSIADLILRSAALALLDRYSESLACCERMLQAPADDPLGNARLLLVHAQLADIAALRGWWDESLAQADWCLRALPGRVGVLVANLHGLRAEALVRQGQAEAARAACDQALAASREPQVEARIATLRAQICLSGSDSAGAERETSRALRLLPGSLAVRYWRGRALLVAGRRDEGTAILRALADDYPNEHWGKQARIADAPFAFASIPNAARVADVSG